MFEDCFVLYSTDINTMYGNDRDLYLGYKEVVDGEDFTDEEMYDYYHDRLREDFNIFWDGLPSAVGHTFIVEYDYGRWDGCYQNVKLMSSLKNTIGLMIEDEDDFDIFFDKDGCLRVNTHNHDASSYYKIYELTERGKAYIERRLEEIQGNKEAIHRMCELVEDVPAYCVDVSNWLR